AAVFQQVVSQAAEHYVSVFLIRNSRAVQELQPLFKAVALEQRRIAPRGMAEPRPQRLHGNTTRARAADPQQHRDLSLPDEPAVLLECLVVCQSRKDRFG